MINWAIFVSGQGTNLQNVLDLEKKELKKSRVVAVVADRECMAIQRARAHGISSVVLSPREVDFVFKLQKFLNQAAVDRIFLLGYMRILSREFLDSWLKPIVNLHPSLLPKYKGLNAIERAFQAKDEVLGVSIHEVVSELDSGRILKQVKVPIPQHADLALVTDLVHQEERKLVREYLLELE